ncbi:gibberellin 20 oxidase 2 [Amborella trichopoda]|uniref:gibberellin 20 oxidase 2 n=1 Tax=Amborella trichopoda TaxID=13333 RepID=UPI0005D3B19D|nr:gibberellin 20 oxidase 2 [Amborella trichopoda]|eukprot:XP_011624256.1 gibberellin 20 oxidase 2 [Amborella trichopoda]
MPAARFDPYFEETTTIVRLNHYPPCPSPELALGKGPHVDTSAFTLLSTDEVSGLEVRRKSDGEWFGSAPHPTPSSLCQETPSRFGQMTSIMGCCIGWR